MSEQYKRNKNRGSMSSLLTSEILRPKAYRKEVTDSLIGLTLFTAIGWKYGVRKVTNFV